MSIKFIKKLRKYIETNAPLFNVPDETKIENFTFESTEMGECVLSFRLAKFMLTLIDDVDEFSYYLDREQDYNRLLREENSSLRDELYYLEEEFEKYKENGYSIAIDMTNSDLVN